MGPDVYLYGVSEPKLLLIWALPGPELVVSARQKDSCRLICKTPCTFLPWWDKVHNDDKGADEHWFINGITGPSKSSMAQSTFLKPDPVPAFSLLAPERTFIACRHVNGIGSWNLKQSRSKSTRWLWSPWGSFLQDVTQNTRIGLRCDAIWPLPCLGLHTV